MHLTINYHQIFERIAPNAIADSPNFTLAILDISLCLPASYFIARCLLYAFGITNRAYGIALMVSINMLLLIVCAGEVAEYTRKRDERRSVFEGELTWWDMEVRRLEDLRLQWKVETEAAGVEGTEIETAQSG